MHSVRAQSFGTPGHFPKPLKKRCREFFKASRAFPGTRRINIFRCVYLRITMSSKARVAESSSTPVAAPRSKARSSGRVDEMPLTPVQRMRQKIALADPALVRRIISDPALEP